MNALDSAWQLIVAVTLRGSVLLACVLLVRWFAGRKIPAQFFGLLWAFVAVKLLLPVAPASSWSVFNLLHWRPSPAFDSARPPWRITLDPVEQEAPVSSPVVSAAPIQEEPISWEGMLVLVWVMGASGQLGWLAWQGRRLRRALADAVRVVDSRTLRLAGMCREQLRLRRDVPIVETTAVSSPAVCGFIRPRLLLPTGFAARHSDDELRFVLLHELAHVRRGDLVVLWLLAAARVLHWFNPAVWVAVRVARHDLEMACDETVLRSSQAPDGTAYGTALLDLAKRLSSPPSALPLAGILDSRHGLKRRIERIIAYTPPHRWRTGLTAAFVLIVALAFGANEKTEVAPPAAAPNLSGVEPKVEPTPVAVPVPAGKSFADGWTLVALSFAQRGSSMIPHARIRQSDGQEFSLFGLGASREGAVLNSVHWTDVRQPALVLTRGDQTVILKLAPVAGAKAPAKGALAEGWKVTGISVPRPGDTGRPEVTVEMPSGVTMTFADVTRNDSNVWLKVSGFDDPALPLKALVHHGEDLIATLPVDRSFVATRARDPAVTPQVVIESKFVEMTAATAERNGLVDRLMGGAPATMQDFVMLAGVYTDPQFADVWKQFNKAKGVDLLASPNITCKSGQRALVEIIREFRYPIEWLPDPARPGAWLPKEWDTKNCGVSLEVTAAVGPDGYTIDLELAPEIVEFLGYADYETRRLVVPKGKPGKLPKPVAPFGPLIRSDQAFARYNNPATFPRGRRLQPIFDEQKKVTTAVTIFDNSTVLLMSRRPAKPAEGQQAGRSPADKVMFVFVTAKLLDPAKPVKE